MNNLTDIESLSPAAEHPEVLRCPKCDRSTVGYCYGCRSDDMHRLLQEEKQKVAALEERLGIVSAGAAVIIPLAELEERAIRSGLASGLSIVKLADRLGIGKTTLYRKCKEMGLPLASKPRKPKPPSVRKAMERVIEIAREAGVPELSQAIWELDHAEAIRATKEVSR